MIRVEHKNSVQKPCFLICKLLILSQKAQEIFRNGILGVCIVDKQAVTVIIMHLALISVAGDGRQLCHQIDAFYQSFINIRIIRVIVIIIQRQHGILKLIHQVLPRHPQQVHFHKFIRDLVAVS